MMKYTGSLKLGKTQESRNAIFSVSLLLPALIVSGFILIYPLCKSLSMSFFRINLMNPKRNQFIGFDNYVQLAQSSKFWEGLLVTVIITAGVVIGAVLLGLIFALLLNLRFKGRGVMRSLMVIPWAIPPVAAVLAWLWILDSQFGILNYILKVMGIIEGNIQWISNTRMAVVSVTLVQIWKQVPIAAVMLLAGLQTIPNELYEASSIDGASYMQRLVHITLPGLKTTAGFLILLITIWTFRQFTVIYLMTEGGPNRATETLVIQIYREAFKYFDIGYAAAIGTITFGISLLFGAVYFRCTTERRAK